jgi:hypothetical protein
VSSVLNLWPPQSQRLNTEGIEKTENTEKCKSTTNVEKPCHLPPATFSQPSR